MFVCRNLPRAIYISLPLVTVIYTLANIAYLAVLDPTSMMASRAIAVVGTSYKSRFWHSQTFLCSYSYLSYNWCWQKINGGRYNSKMALYLKFIFIQTFGDKVLGMMSWIMPVLVAISAFGGLSVHIMTSSRMCFVGARNGHFPAMLSHINVTKFTPMPALVFLVWKIYFISHNNNIYLLSQYLTVNFFVSVHFIFANVMYKWCICTYYILQYCRVFFHYGFGCWNSLVKIHQTNDDKTNQSIN